MNKSQLVSLVTRLALLAREDATDVESMNVAALESMVDKLLGVLEGPDSEAFNTYVKNLEEQLAALNSVENNNVLEFVKLLNTKEERIKEFEAINKQYEEKVRELCLTVQALQTTNDSFKVEQQKWEEAKMMAEALRRVAKNEKPPVVQEPQDCGDNFKVLMKALEIVPADALWERITVFRTGDQFTVFFDTTFYEANYNTCYGFLGRIRARAIHHKHRAWFDKSHLVIRLRANNNNHQGPDI